MKTLLTLARLMAVMLVYVALGPALDAVCFAAFALLRAANPEEHGFGFVRQMISLMDDRLAWSLTYAIGIWPALLTGLLYAAWDAAAPVRAPRPLVAAVLGGIVTFGFIWSMMSNVSSAAHLGSDPSSRDTEQLLRMAHANILPPIVAGGAIAGYICAVVSGFAKFSLRPRTGSLASRVA